MGNWQTSPLLSTRNPLFHNHLLFILLPFLPLMCNFPQKVFSDAILVVSFISLSKWLAGWNNVCNSGKTSDRTVTHRNAAFFTSSLVIADIFYISFVYCVIQMLTADSLDRWIHKLPSKSIHTAGNELIWYHSHLVESGDTFGFLAVYWTLTGISIHTLITERQLGMASIRRRGSQDDSGFTERWTHKANGTRALLHTLTLTSPTGNTLTEREKGTPI